MGDLSRIGVAIDSELLEKFDNLISDQGYTNRSEAFRDLIRDRLISIATQSPKATVVGSITLIYDHHVRMLPAKLTEMQHDYHDVIVSTTHAHLDHHACLEVIVVKGESRRVHALANLLIGVKGVQHGRLVVTSPDIQKTKIA